MLTCRVTGDNITGVYWERVDGISLPNSNNKSLLNNAKTRLQLTISTAHPMYTGSYRCVVYSQWGVAQSRNVRVTITSKSNNVLM